MKKIRSILLILLFFCGCLNCITIEVKASEITDDLTSKDKVTIIQKNFIENKDIYYTYSNSLEDLCLPKIIDGVTMNFESDLELYNIIGEDNRRPVSAQNIFTIFAYYLDDNTATRGTGFLVARNTIATCAHCVYHPELGKFPDYILLYFADRTDPVYVSLEDTIFNFDENYFSGQPAGTDWTVGFIGENLGTGFAYEANSTIGIGTNIYVIGNQGETYPSLYMDNGVVKRLETSSTGVRMHYDADAAPGWSGGPVFNLNGTVIGIHASGGTLTNGGTLITPAIFQTIYDTVHMFD